MSSARHAVDKGTFVAQAILCVPAITQRPWKRPSQRHRHTEHQAERVRPVQGEHGFPVPLRQAFDALHLIDDQAAPAYTREGRVAPEEQLVGRDADVEAVGLGPALHTQNTQPQTSPPRPRLLESVSGARSQVFTTELRNLPPAQPPCLCFLQASYHCAERS